MTRSLSTKKVKKERRHLSININRHDKHLTRFFAPVS